MKSSKSFLLCLLAGLFIAANCAEVISTVSAANVTLPTTIKPTTKGETNETTSTLPPTSSSTTEPITTSTVTPDTTTTASNTTTTSSTTTSTTTTTTTPATTSSTSTTASPNTTTTTPVPSSTSTTEIPSTTTAAPPAPCDRFKVTSFIGGIVLTLGLLAISLVAYKFYKARNERNYHTL